MNKAGIFLIVFLFPAAIYCAPAEGYYRFPDIHGGRIVFTAQGDLWTVGTNGGLASRLTSDPGTEFNAKISPDGKIVAFSAQYEGPTEVYTMPLDGGIPVRLTYEGGDALVRGWTPDGKIIYSTYHFSTYPSWQLVLIDPKTSFSEIVPLAQASDGVYEKSAGGEGTLYFTRLNAQSSHTKRYKGGTAQNIWRWEKGMEEAVPLTGDYSGTSKNPMIWMGRIYFASDRDGTMNIWSMASDGTDKRQETFHRGFDISSPSLDGGKIVYHEGADIYLYDIASKSDKVVPIELSSDFDQEVRQWVKNPMDYLTSAHISQDGGKIVLTARGQVFAAPARNGRLVEVTRKSGVRYYNAAFMPDGKSILLQSDESGEIEYWKYPADGTGSGEKLTSLGKGYRYGGVISPDGRYFAFTDRGGRLFVRDSESGAVNEAASSKNGEFSDLAWSPDSRWLAYSGPADNFFMRIWLYRVKDKTNYMLTGDRVQSYNPVWSRDGKWLYFLSDRTFNSGVDSPWGQNQPEPYFDKTTGIYALSLYGNESFPFIPPDELHNPEEAGTPAVANTNAIPVKIDLNGIGSRLFQVPVPAGNYSRLAAGDEFLFFTERTENTGLSNKLDAVEITNICPQVTKIEENVKDFELSGNGKKLMVGKGDGFFIIDAAGSPPEDIDKKAVDLSDWSYSFNPEEEWRQMFIDAWRLERDYFYDPGMHGADYESVLKRYLPLVDRIRDRDELNDLLGQIVGELSALHTFVFGGDLRKPSVEIDVGSLGATITRYEKGGGYRIDHINRTDPDYPGFSSPLSGPGAGGINEGDIITGVNGIPVLGAASLESLLVNQAGRQVLLHLRSGSTGKEYKSIVVPLSWEKAFNLRYADWEYSRRLIVEKESGNKIGYVHLRAMGGGNYTEWVRQFYPVFNREGLIIDVRGNRGGNIDSWILEKLLRKAWMYFRSRGNNPDRNMQYAFIGHIAVICNEGTSSDGELFSEGFKRLGLGKVIGTRTWGGAIGLDFDNQLLDQGMATAAELGSYGPEGKWIIEGHGVDPDIVVDNTPHRTFEGEDAQLEAAIRELQQEIRENPMHEAQPPEYPRKAMDYK